MSEKYRFWLLLTLLFLSLALLLLANTTMGQQILIKAG
jgi:hypothetical protein